MALVAGAAIAGVATAVSAGVVGGVSIGAAVAIGAVTFAVKVTTALIANSKDDTMDEAVPTSKAAANQIIVKSPTAPHKIIYGRAIVSGVLAYSNTSGDNKEYLHLLIVLAAHEVDAIGDIYLDEIHEEAEEIAGHVKVWRHLGGSKQVADPELVHTFGEWTAAHRLRGLAYVHVRLLNDADAPFRSVPNIKAVVQGRKVVDPRNVGFKDVTRIVWPDIAATLSQPVTMQDQWYFAADQVAPGGGGALRLLGQAASAGIIIDAQANVLVVEFDTGPAYSFDFSNIIIDTPVDIAVSYYKGLLSIIVGDQYDQLVITPEPFTIAGIDNENITFTSGRIVFGEMVGIAPVIDVINWHDDAVDIGGTYYMPNKGSGGDMALSGWIEYTNTESSNPEDWHRSWSKNAALNIYDFLMSKRWGMGVDIDKIDIDIYKNAADLCGAILPGYNEPCLRARYTLDGVINVDAAIGNTLQSMLTSCAGVVVWRNGLFALIVGAPGHSVMTITSDMIIGDISMGVVASKAGVFNTTKAGYISAAQNWQSAETAPYTDQDAIDNDGIEILQSIDLPFTDSDYNAQRLAIIFLKLSRLEGSLELIVKREAFALRAMDVVEVHVPEAGIINEFWRVSEWSLEPAAIGNPGAIKLLLKEYDPDAYEVPPGDVIQPPALPEIPPFGDDIAPVDGFFAISGSTTIDPDGDIFVHLGWEPSSNPLCIGYRLTSQIAGGSIEVHDLPGRLSISWDDFAPEIGDIVEYKIIAVINSITYSAEVAITHQVNDGSLPPAPPASFEVTPTTGNLAKVSYTAMPNPDIVGYELRAFSYGNYQEGKGAFIGLLTSSGTEVYISGYSGTQFALRAVGANGLVSTPLLSDPDLVAVDDQWAPAYDWGEWSLLVDGCYIVIDYKQHDPHYLITQSTLIAADQDWETFDDFVEAPVEDRYLGCFEDVIAEGQTVQYDFFVGTNIPAGTNYPHDAPVAAIIKFLVYDGTTWINQQQFDTNTGLITYTAPAGITKTRIDIYPQNDWVVPSMITHAWCRRGGDYEQIV